MDINTKMTPSWRNAESFHKNVCTSEVLEEFRTFIICIYSIRYPFDENIKYSIMQHIVFIVNTLMYAMLMLVLEYAYLVYSMVFLFRFQNHKFSN